MMDFSALNRRTLLKHLRPRLLRSAMASARTSAPAARRRSGSRALPCGEDRLAAGAGESDHGRGDSRELFRQPDRAAPQFEALTGITSASRRSRRRRSGRRASSTSPRRPAPTRPTPPTRCITRSTRPTNGSSRSTPISRTRRSPTPAWFRADDIVPAWRAANSVGGKLLGMPYDGEVTLQVLRKDLYDAKGLKPAETLEQFVSNAAALHDAEQPRLGHGASRRRGRRPERLHLLRPFSASSAATG